MHEHRTSVPVATFQDPQRATIPCEELLGHASHSVTFHRPGHGLDVSSRYGDVVPSQ